MEQFEDDDGDSCQHCGGDGWCEVDDPINDDCDEFGFGICRHCLGTGHLPPWPRRNDGSA